MNTADPIAISKIATFNGHKDCIYAIENGINNDFYSAGSDGMVVAWNLERPDNGELVANVANSVYALHFLAKNNQLLVGQNHEGIYQIDLASKSILKSSKITNSQIFDIKTTGEFILIATGDGQLIVLSIHDLTVITKIQVAEKSVRVIAINPISPSFAIGLSDFSIRIFSSIDFREIHQLQDHKNSVFSLAYSPDGSFLLSGSRDAAIKIWQSATQYQLKHSIPAHLFAVNDIAYNAKGNLFATASMDKTIKIWNSENFRLLKVIDKARYQSHFTSVNKLLWLNDSQLLSASDDKKIFLWNIEINE
ncbi:MAG: WD40 repeat domain-containing protein [Cytophagales bacterium]|nr:MAG: WD40 repeat domain-containing protein [Cytophagales bacterium]